MLYYGLVFYPVVPVVNYNMEYRSPHFWGSRVLPVNVYNNIIARIPFMVAEWYLTITGGFATGFLALTATSHVKVVTYWTVVLR